MRTLAVLVAVAFLVLPGCTGGAPGAGDTGADSFADLGVAPTSTTGIILGVVVDSAIRPIKGAAIDVSGVGVQQNATTDDDGRFAVGGLPAGTYLLKATHVLFGSVQTNVDVVPGDVDPPIVRMQMARLFSQDPYTEALKFDGFIACGFNAGTVAPCVTDYTQVLPPCGGGCAPQLRTIMGDRRDYLTAIGPGWQQLVIEMTFEPSAQATSSEMGFIVSHPNRTGATHSFGSAQGPSPVRWQADVGVEAEGAASQEPTMIPAEGWPDLLVFSNVRSSDDVPAAVTVNQAFTIFQHNFYYGKPPEGWSFANGDTAPF